jgi:hypothetical protein
MGGANCETDQGACEVRTQTGGYFDAPVDDCKAMTLVIQRGTLVCVGRVAAGNADRHGDISLGDRAVPDFVAALALPDLRAAGGAQQVS